MTRCWLRILWAGSLLFSMAPGIQAEEESEWDRGHLLWAVSPVVGVDRNELTVHGPRGVVSKQTETAPEYGLFAMMAHPNFVVNNFIFYSHVNDADVFGNLAYANYYVNSEDSFTWHAGAGYLYHQIEPENESIEVNVPMLKAGPHIRVKPLHLTVTPYAGYAWERVETDHGDSPNDSWLYGLRTGWRWRMIEANINYYYQDSQDLEEDFQTVHARLHFFFNKTVGLLARVDYMEHQTTTDTSYLLGPTLVW